MKRLVVFLVLAGILMSVAATIAAEAGDNYLVLRGGIGWMDEKDRTAGNYNSHYGLENEYELNLAYGRRFGWVRPEIELGFLDMDIDHMMKWNLFREDDVGTEQQYRLMVNVFADWKNSSDFTVFAGVGIGPAIVHLEKSFTGVDAQGNSVGAIMTSDDTDTVLAYQAMAGASYQISEDWALELMYRMYGTTEQTFSQSGGFQTSVEVEDAISHNVDLGVRYSF
jgi:opacity protein-like surface antigen